MSKRASTLSTRKNYRKILLLLVATSICTIGVHKINKQSTTINFCRVLLVQTSLSTLTHSKNSKKHNFPNINFHDERDFVLLFCVCFVLLLPCCWSDEINNYYHCVFLSVVGVRINVFGSSVLSPFYLLNEIQIRENSSSSHTARHEQVSVKIFPFIARRTRH